VDAGTTVLLWQSRGPAEITRFEDHPGLVQALAFSPDGSLLASAGYQRVVVRPAREGITQRCTLDTHTELGTQRDLQPQRRDDGDRGR